MTQKNPTDEIDVSFDAYISNSRKTQGAHLIGGIPDYAFASDYTLRRKLRALPGVFPLFKAITSYWVPYTKQTLNMEGLRVGADQYPDIYGITAECAEILGIAIPTVYIIPVMYAINAYTIATDDESPVIVLYSSMVERFTKDELKAVIGHECGHIHNNHGIYNLAAQIILKMGMEKLSDASSTMSSIFSFASLPIRLMLSAWSRAAEVTCDRAGMICANDPLDAVRMNAKLMSGAMLGAEEVNIKAALKQYETLKKSALRFLELADSHPLPVRRMFASLEFMNSDILYGWRPEWRTPDMALIDRNELEARCVKYVCVSREKKGRKKR